MPADSQEQEAVKQQALNALAHLGSEDKQKILEYIKGLVILEKSNDDQAGTT